MTTPENPAPELGEIRTVDGRRMRFIEREAEGDKWEVLDTVTPAPSSLREAYARIIDADAFDQIDAWERDCRYGPIKNWRPSLVMRRDEALAKADDILALPAAPTPLVGGEG